MIKYLVSCLSVISVISLSACSGEHINALNEDEDGSVAITVPVLEQCLETVTENLDALGEDSDIRYTYTELSYVPQSHRDLAGVVEVRSSTLHRLDLVIVLDIFMVYCNPTSSTSFPKAQASLFDVAEEITALRERGAVGKIYVDIGDEEITLRYQDLSQ